MIKELTLFIDVETGGLNPYDHDILTFALNIDDNTGTTILRLQYKIIADPLRVSEEASKINGINLEEHNKNAWNKDEVKKHFLKTLELLKPYKLRVVGQNVMFDIGFLNHNLLGEDTIFKNTPINDTIIMSKTYAYKKGFKLPNHKLKTLAEHFKYEETKYHDAMNDVLATKHVYYSIINQK